MLDRLATETWRDLGAGERLGVPLNEESVTDYNLLRLSQRAAGVRTRKHPKPEEKFTGADWEWWVQDERGFWRCLRVQAKRVSMGRGRPTYRELAKSATAPTSQIDKLLCNSRWRGYRATPIYAFYNTWIPPLSPRGIEGGLVDLSSSCPRTSSNFELHGWTALDARTVRCIVLWSHYVAHEPTWAFDVCVRGAHPVGCWFLDGPGGPCSSASARAAWESEVATWEQRLELLLGEDYFGDDPDIRESLGEVNEPDTGMADTALPYHVTQLLAAPKPQGRGDITAAPSEELHSEFADWPADLAGIVTIEWNEGAESEGRSGSPTNKRH